MRAGAEARSLSRSPSSHVIQRKSMFESVFGEPPASEHRPRIIDEDVDARLMAGDFGAPAFHLRDAG